MTKQVHSFELACSEKDTLSENIPDLLNTEVSEKRNVPLNPEDFEIPFESEKLKSLVQLKLTVHEKRIL